MFNDFDGLRKTLEFVERQEVKCEVIVKDGSDCKYSRDFIEAGTFRNLHLKYLNQNDDGIYDAINQALDLCRGNHIWIVGCGDLPFVSVLKKLGIEAGISYAAPVLLSDGFVRQMYHGRLTPSHQGLVYCKEAYQTRRYSTNYKIISDRIFYDEYIAENKFPIMQIAEPICEFQLNGISSSKSSKKIILNEMLSYVFLMPRMKNILRVISAFRNFVLNF